MGTTNTLDLNNRIDALKKSVTENVKDTHDSEKDIYAVMGQMGAKNLIPYPYTDTTITINGVTFTDNGDGSITVNGTASANADFQIRARATDAIAKLIKNRYTFSGAPTGGGNSTYDMRIGDTVNGSWHPLGFDFGEGVTFELDNDVINVGIGIRIAKNYVCNNLIFKPMLRLASDTDDTYQPYAKTNRELTESYPADKVLMSDGVTSVEDAVDELNSSLILKDVINLSPYDSSSNMYTFPKDGYLFLASDNDASTAEFAFYTNLNQWMGSIKAQAGFNGMQVKKGTRGFCSIVSQASVKFCPFYIN